MEIETSWKTDKNQISFFHHSARSLDFFFLSSEHLTGEMHENHVYAAQREKI